MYRRILVPVDGSEASTLGLKEAIKLAKDKGSQILLLYVVSELIRDYTAAGIYEGELIDALRRVGRDILQNAESIAQLEGVRAESKMLESIGRTAAVAIVEQAKAWPADLIVMGTHGRRGVRRLALGSDAEQVVRTAPVPVLLVRGASESIE